MYSRKVLSRSVEKRYPFMPTNCGHRKQNVQYEWHARHLLALEQRDVVRQLTGWMWIELASDFARQPSPFLSTGSPPECICHPTEQVLRKHLPLHKRDPEQRILRDSRPVDETIGNIAVDTEGKDFTDDSELELLSLRQ